MHPPVHPTPTGSPRSRSAPTPVAAAVLALVAVVGVLGLGARPASASALPPTSARAEIVAVEPATDGVSLEVLGGDAALHLTVAAGHEVVVLGYAGEPYLRVATDGTVSANTTSPAWWLNRTRNATTAPPPSADAAADPQWVTIGSDGRATWHDHRIHTMPGAPTVNEWKVSLVVDGVATEVDGTLRSVPAPSPWPWLVVAVAVLGATLWLGRGRQGRVAAVAVLLGALPAAAVAVAEWVAAPVALGRPSAQLGLAIGALVAAGVAVGVVLRPGRAEGSGGPLATIAVLAAASLLGGWVAVRFAVFTDGVLLGPLPDAADRLITALVAGLAAAAAGLAVASGDLVPQAAPGTRLEH